MDLTFLTATDSATLWLDNQAQAVIKRFRDPSNPQARVRWCNETSSLHSIGVHPGVVQLLSSSGTDLTITLSLAPGQVLSSYDPTTISFLHARQICLQLSEALSHIHSLGLVHDDVKPDNIMCLLSSASSLDLTVTLIDFGACVRSDNFTKSGTPWYVAPEFMQQIKDSRADVWALGVTMAWVLGEFALPDRSRKEWVLPLIWEDEAAREAMERWLEVVAQARERLRMRSSNVLERVLVEMLEPVVERRIKACEVVKRLTM